MNGAEALLRTLLASGVDTCFANPGTSEMHFVAALDRVPGMRAVLGLFEGVVAGAADGYGRMTSRPAATLFHCGPGLANGLSLLHNARRSRTPIVNIVGDQATYHAPLDPPLTTDVEAWAAPVSCWVRTTTRTPELGEDAAEAVWAARCPPGGIATLVLPSDVSWNPGGRPGAARPVPAPAAVTTDAVKDAARALASREPALLLLGGSALLEPGLTYALRVASATGAKVMAPTFNARIARGRGRFAVDSIAYPAAQAIAEMAGIRHVILVGATLPVGFFAYPDTPGTFTPADAVAHTLAGPEHDLADALARLGDELGCPEVRPASEASSITPGRGTNTPEGAARTLAALLPEDAIVVDEAITLRAAFFAATRHAARHDYLQIPGGAIGGGLPVATGAAVACPGRRVIAVQADGSAMYTLQAFWTQAREKLDVTTVILANRKYAVLFHELTRVQAGAGPTAHDLFDLARPDLDWQGMARAMGVEAARADTLERFADLLSYGNSRPGPLVIELTLA